MQRILKQLRDFETLLRYSGNGDVTDRFREIVDKINNAPTRLQKYGAIYRELHLHDDYSTLLQDMDDKTNAAAITTSLPIEFDLGTINGTAVYSFNIGTM